LKVFDVRCRITLRGTGYGLDGLGLESRKRQEICLFSKTCVWGPHSLLLKRYRACFPEVKRAGRQVDHQPPSKVFDVRCRITLRGTGYGLDRLGFESRERQEICLFSKTCVWGPHSLLLKRYRACFPEVQRAGRQVDHQPPSNAEVKNEWS
jgi:uncharacterized Fe-S cluster protein YjdI